VWHGQPIGATPHAEHFPTSCTSQDSGAKPTHLSEGKDVGALARIENRGHVGGVSRTMWIFLSPFGPCYPPSAIETRVGSPESRCSGGDQARMRRLLCTLLLIRLLASLAVAVIESGESDMIEPPRSRAREACPIDYEVISGVARRSTWCRVRREFFMRDQVVASYEILSAVGGIQRRVCHSTNPWMNAEKATGRSGTLRSHFHLSSAYRWPPTAVQ
jgi:hypothetical protein